MSSIVEWVTPAGTMALIGPYSHVAKVGQFITIGATAGVDPATGDLVGPDVASQTRQILEAFEIMLATIGSSLDHVIHINVFLADMQDILGDAAVGPLTNSDIQSCLIDSHRVCNKEPS